MIRRLVREFIMCGRFALTISPAVLAKIFQLLDVPQIKPRYNIAPGQSVLSIVSVGKNVKRESRKQLWGLIPPWASDIKKVTGMINARSESAAVKPAFREALIQRRCLIPADGFYEWKRSGRQKQPFFFRLLEQIPMALAGLWELWKGPAGQNVESCAILTTACNSLMQPIHDRMPVIIDPAAYNLWLDNAEFQAELLKNMFQSYPAEKMTAYPVSQIVNSTANDRPDCIKPVGENKTDEHLLF